MYQRIPPLFRRSFLPSGADSHDPNAFFRYTTGRWLDNEASEQQRRYLAFDIDGLKAAAVAAVEGAKSVVRMTKLPEGSYSKAFSMVLDNHKEVIARLPTPHAGPAHLVTASEVATMEFARRNLGVPVPRVLSWCSTRASTAVGAEYIIMEKASGIEVDKVWPQLSQEHRLHLIDEIARIEKAKLEHPLPCYGSIFFRDDLGPEVASVVVDDTFSIGPSMEKIFWGAEREAMDIDRGPWSEVPEYLSALCSQEQQWIRLYASSQPVRPFRDHPLITREPSVHLAVLDHFRSVIPNIVPFGLPKLSQPTLWHHDLSGSNIFISDTELAKGRISLTSVIDWQNTSVSPLYMQARVPRVIRYHAPWNLPDGLEIVALPEDLEGQSQSDQRAAMDDVDAKNLEIYYRSSAARHSPYYYHALTDAYTTLFAAIATTASLSWSGIHILRDKLLTLQSVWTRYTSAPCPLRITDDEAKSWRLAAQQWQDRQDEFNEICKRIGVDGEGWMAVEDFKATYSWYKKVKKDWISRGGAESDWPFSGPMLEQESKGSLVEALRRLFAWVC